jgi:hypothetical protein
MRRAVSLPLRRLTHGSWNGAMGGATVLAPRSLGTRAHRMTFSTHSTAAPDAAPEMTDAERCVRACVCAV